MPAGEFRRRQASGFGDRVLLLGIPFLCWDAPPSSFSPCAEKKKSAVHGGEEKEGFWVQTCYNFVSILLRSFVEHGAAWRSVVTLPVLLTALRAGAGLGRCAVRSVFFCCASIAQVYRGCTAADLFRCISLFAVAAQCAL